MRARSRIRSDSGVFPIPVYTRPNCCGGDCIYCPREEGIPRGYVANEDTLFAKEHLYSPVAQLERFFDQLPITDHDCTLPCEVIVIGGSFSALEHTYRSRFMLDIYERLSRPLMTDVLNELKGTRFTPSIVTVEARPDQITAEECNQLRHLGISKVELGVQHTSDCVLDFNNRGHALLSTVRATRLLKDKGFKVGYHVMLGLPHATIEDDERMLQSTLWEPEFSPDYLKVYPCVLFKDSRLQPKLFELYRQRKWRPISDQEVVTLLSLLAKVVPHHVRIARIQRQFENRRTVDGVSAGIRGKFPIRFSDLRSREVGRVLPDTPLEQLGDIQESVTMRGVDIIIELFYAKEVSLGIARLRVRNKKEVILRELKVFGKPAAIGYPGLVQGKGLGKRLLRKAEDVAINLGASHLFVNAAFGVRAFFQHQGFTIDSTSMLRKRLKEQKINDC